jgi:UDP-glucose 4-epimerase
MVQNRIGCPIKANKDLGFEYEIDLEKGLQDLISWREANS